MPADDSQQSHRRNGEPVPPGDDVILSEATAAPGRPEPLPATPLTPHDLATPYVLDALTLDEREAYEEHLAGCAICQQRVSELETISGLLPDALVTPPADLPDAYPYLLRDVAHEILPLSAAMPADADPAVPTVPLLRTGNAAEPSDEPGYDAGDELVAPGPAVITEPAPVPAPAPGPAIVTPEPDSAPANQPADRLAAAENDREAPVVTRSPRRDRPPGRIRPGVRPAAGYAPDDTPALQRSSGRPSSVVIGLAVLGVIAIGLFLWALLLQGRVNDLEDEIDQQNTEIASLRQQANATAYTLSPTIDGPPAASGTFFFSLPDQRGALVARGLAAAPEGQAYQIWYIEDESSTPIAGPTFQVDANGEAVVPLTAEVSTFDAVAISLEPADGSDAPTTPLLLQGRLGGAAG